MRPTFDDGYADFVEHALPSPAPLGLRGDPTVLPGRLGDANAWDPLGRASRCWTADGIRRAAAEGVEIGLARSHPTST